MGRHCVGPYLFNVLLVRGKQKSTKMTFVWPSVVSNSHFTCQLLNTNLEICVPCSVIVLTVPLKTEWTFLVKTTIVNNTFRSCCFSGSLQAYIWSMRTILCWDVIDFKIWWFWWPVSSVETTGGGIFVNRNQRWTGLKFYLTFWHSVPTRAGSRLLSKLSKPECCHPKNEGLRSRQKHSPASHGMERRAKKEQNWAVSSSSIPDTTQSSVSFGGSSCTITYIQVSAVGQSCTGKE